MTTLCRVMQVSTSTYYNFLASSMPMRYYENNKLRTSIEIIHRRSRNTYGKRRVQAELRSEGKRHGLIRISRLMKESGLKAKAAKKYKATINSCHDLITYENKLDRKFSPTKPSTHFTSDITYIRTLNGWLFLAVVIDLYSRKVVGWSMANHMRAELVCNALQMAKIKGVKLSGSLHHSDRGVQYCSNAFQSLLSKNNMTPSMSRKGNCWDNAPTESFFHSLKVESVENKIYKNHEEAKQENFDYIEVFYNIQRLHWECLLNCVISGRL